MRRLAALVALGAASCAAAQAPIPREVQAVIDRSHNARGPYAVFLTTEVTAGDVHRTETDTEFQRGALHRIEVPAVRTLTNCETGENIAYDVAHGRYLEEDGDMKGVCGIDVDADPPLSARMLKPITGPYGRADVIELTGAKFVRRYAVTDDGIIVSNDYVPRSAAIDFTLRTVRSVVRRGPQDAAMFTRESLARGFAPSAAPSAREP